MSRYLLPAAAVACLLLSACGGNSARQAAVDAANAGLPSAYRDGLVTERAHSKGNAVVLDIRFAEARVAQLQAKPFLRDALQVDEQEAISELCADAALGDYLKDGGVVRRRFIDADGALFFEVSLDGRHCPPS